MEETQPIPLPRTLVLNYLTRSNTPTRARRIASVVLYVLAGLTLLGGGLLLLNAAYTAHYFAVSYSAGWTFYTPYSTSPSPPAASFTSELSLFLEMLVHLPETWWGAFLLGLGISYIICAIGVRRGSRKTAIVATWIFVPALLIPAFLSAIWTGAAIVNLMGWYGKPDPGIGFLAIPGILLIGLTLLALDVHTMLRWAARNPVEEMAKRKFLPQ